MLKALRTTFDFDSSDDGTPQECVLLYLDRKQKQRINVENKPQQSQIREAMRPMCVAQVAGGPSSDETLRAPSQSSSVSTFVVGIRRDVAAKRREAQAGVNGALSWQMGGR